MLGAVGYFYAASWNQYFAFKYFQSVLCYDILRKRLF